MFFFCFFFFFFPQWLSVVSLAVLYNIVFVIGRAVFWELNKQAAVLWWILDYLCDFIYLADTLVHCHEGKFACNGGEFHRNNITSKL